LAVPIGQCNAIVLTAAAIDQETTMPRLDRLGELLECMEWTTGEDHHEHRDGNARERGAGDSAGDGAAAQDCDAMSADELRV
jgi:hypothetical protein